MRRILLVLATGIVMAAMLAASALPALGLVFCDPEFCLTHSSPGHSATKVPRNTDVTAYFSRGLDPNTVNSTTFTLTKKTNWGTSQPIPATIAVDGFSAKLDPSANLRAFTKYEVTIKGGSSGVKSTAGETLPKDEVRTFTTGFK